MFLWIHVNILNQNIYILHSKYTLHGHEYHREYGKSLEFHLRAKVQ